VCVTGIDVVSRWTIGAASAAAGSRVQWNTMSVVAHQGDNVTLVCTVRAVDFIDVVQLTLTPSPDDLAAAASHTVAKSARQRWTIADNNVVKPAFLALPRYGVTMTVNGRRAVVQLQITGEYSDCLSLHHTRDSDRRRSLEYFIK